MEQKESIARLLDELGRTPSGEAVVVVSGGETPPALLQLLPGMRDRLYPEDIPDVMKGVDVTLLTEFIFPRLLEIPGDHLDDVGRVHYHHDARAVLDKVAFGQYDMAFIIKPTPIQAVQQIAAAGLVMPRKSTYFAPKVISGLVIHALA
jgi:uncharacterized protein (DUF1015 family)